MSDYSKTLREVCNEARKSEWEKDENAVFIVDGEKYTFKNLEGNGQKKVKKWFLS
jgi:hypothetical protein